MTNKTSKTNMTDLANILTNYACLVNFSAKSTNYACLVNFGAKSTNYACLVKFDGKSQTKQNIDEKDIINTLKSATLYKI